MVLTCDMLDQRMLRDDLSVLGQTADQLFRTVMSIDVPHPAMRCRVPAPLPDPFHMLPDMHEQYRRSTVCSRELAPSI